MAHPADAPLLVANKPASDAWVGTYYDLQTERWARVRGMHRVRELKARGRVITYRMPEEERRRQALMEVHEMRRQIWAVLSHCLDAWMDLCLPWLI
jgi:adenylate cyclase class IV